MWQVKKKRNNKKNSCQHHISLFAELEGGEMFSEKKNFTRAQTKPKIL